jgi:hypothetical protein
MPPRRSLGHQASKSSCPSARGGGAECVCVCVCVLGGGVTSGGGQQEAPQPPSPPSTVSNGLKCPQAPPAPPPPSHLDPAVVVPRVDVHVVEGGVRHESRRQGGVVAQEGGLPGAEGRGGRGTTAGGAARRAGSRPRSGSGAQGLYERRIGHEAPLPAAGVPCSSLADPPPHPGAPCPCRAPSAAVPPRTAAPAPPAPRWPRPYSSPALGGGVCVCVRAPSGVKTTSRQRLGARFGGTRCRWLLITPPIGPAPRPRPLPPPGAPTGPPGSSGCRRATPPASWRQRHPSAGQGGEARERRLGRAGV